MSSLKQVQTTLINTKSFLMNKYDVKSLYIFGSYARQEQTQQSDVDILIDFKKTPDLLTFIEIEEYLSEQLQQHVDLVPKRKLKKQLKDKILQEAVII